jgi:hypothetical protein
MRRHLSRVCLKNALGARFLRKKTLLNSIP